MDFVKSRLLDEELKIKGKSMQRSNTIIMIVLLKHFLLIVINVEKKATKQRNVKVNRQVEVGQVVDVVEDTDFVVMVRKKLTK